MRSYIMSERSREESLVLQKKKKERQKKEPVSGKKGISGVLEAKHK